MYNYSFTLKYVFTVVCLIIYNDSLTYNLYIFHLADKAVLIQSFKNITTPIK